MHAKMAHSHCLAAQSGAYVTGMCEHPHHAAKGDAFSTRRGREAFDIMLIARGKRQIRFRSLSSRLTRSKEDVDNAIKCFVSTQQEIFQAVILLDSVFSSRTTSIFKKSFLHYNDFIVGHNLCAKFEYFVDNNVKTLGSNKEFFLFLKCQIFTAAFVLLLKLLSEILNPDAFRLDVP